MNITIKSVDNETTYSTIQTKITTNYNSRY